ncbi:MAG: 3-hydroxyacyl-CoA dehydrogenase family protein [Bacteroidales bacterium]|jgi:3-hydroxybutyryl-CoA dehydrogenase|nr:3-hydroxyacyl-CoA dehydrogenase family protein [Bacteroidales bacterium]
MSEIIEPIEHFGLSRKDTKKKLFSRIGVVGCGHDGQHIVGLTASAGLEVIFADISEEKINMARNNISRNLDTKVENWGLTTSEKHAIMSRIRGTLDYNDLKGCDFVIECIRYDEKTGERNTFLRKEVFKQMENILEPNAVIATNASTVIISELASDLEYKERCISLNFLVAQPDAGIIEIVKGLYTSDEVFEKMKLFCKIIKHDYISVHESNGIVSMRLFVTLLNEACQMLMENIASLEDIDKLLQVGYGYRLGVFRSADLLGIEKLVPLMNNMFDEYGDKKYKPSPLLLRLYRAKHFGVREQKGFYLYDENGKILRSAIKN